MVVTLLSGGVVPASGATGGPLPPASVSVSLVIQLGHGGPVDCGAFSPDGQAIVTGGADGAILWNANSGGELRKFSARDVKQVGFGAAGRQVFTASAGGLIQFWEVTSGLELRHVQLAGGHSFSRDGRLALGRSAESPGVILLEDTGTGRVLKRFQGGSAPLNDVALSADGRRAVAVSNDGTIQLWETATGRRLHRFAGVLEPPPRTGYHHIAISPDGRWVMTEDGKGRAHVWNADTGRQSPAWFVATKSEAVLPFAFSPDGRLVASTGDTGPTLSEIPSGGLLGALHRYQAQSRFVAWSYDGKRLLEIGNNIRLWDVTTRLLLRELTSPSAPVNDVAFSEDGQRIVAATENGEGIWDLASGREVRQIPPFHRYSELPDPKGAMHVRFAREPHTVQAEFRNSVQVWDTETGQNIREFRADRLVRGAHQTTYSLAPDGRLVAAEYYTRSDGQSNLTGVHFLETGTRKRLELKFPAETFDVGDLSPDARYFLAVSYAPNGLIALFETQSGRELRRWNLSYTGHIFLPEGRLLLNAASTGASLLHLYSIARQEDLWTIEPPPQTSSYATSPDGSFIVVGNARGELWRIDSRSGVLQQWPTGHRGSVNSIAYSPDGKWVLTGSADRMLRLADADNGRELCRLSSSADGTWVVVAPDGRFDANNLEHVPGLHWVVDDDPLHEVPLEAFMRQYYEPRLLPRLLAGEAFKPLPSISTLNRALPIVELEADHTSDGAYATMTVRVSSTRRRFTRDGRSVTEESGAYDLRVFRDGQLVGYAPTGDGALPLDPKTGTAVFKFANIPLLQDGHGSTSRFSAYAFNADRVKSVTARQEVSGGWNGPYRRTAYLISMGVNASENPAWDLRFAANDARRLQSTLGEIPQEQGGIKDRYDVVVKVPLISDYTMNGDDRLVTEQAATRENLETVLALLAGREVDPRLRQKIPNGDKLGRAWPQDLIILTFSSHGYTDSNGVFYLLPYDIGPGNGHRINRDVLARSISSDQLAHWIRDVDAGDIVMIFDACHSAAAVEGSDFKPGPINSRGLGQLAYDKRAMVLAATQSDSAALESPLTNLGLLTYALVAEGLEKHRADRSPADKRITIREWLSYAVDRVPGLAEEVVRGQAPRGAKGGMLEPADTAGGSPVRSAVQVPTLFDFRVSPRQPIVSTSP